MNAKKQKQTTLKEDFEELKKLEEEKEKIFQHTIKGWKHTLDMWSYWMKVDFVMSLFGLVSGMLIGLLWGGILSK